MPHQVACQGPDEGGETDVVSQIAMVGMAQVCLEEAHRFTR
jgi:hypothetical protein